MADEPAAGVELRHYLSVPVRRWLTIVMTTLVGVALGVAYTMVSPVSYSATSEVNITVITSDPFNASRSASGLLDIPGEARLAGSYAVAERAAASLDGTSPEAIREAVDVVGSADSATLRITAEADSAARARAIADSVAVEYLAYRSAQADARIDRTEQAARERLEDARASLQSATEQFAQAEPGSVDAVQAEVDQSLLNLEIRSVLDELSAARSIDTTGGSVINPAAAAAVERQPSRALVLATGALVGFALGLVLAFVLDALDTRVRDRRDVLGAGGGPFVVRLTSRDDDFPPQSSDLDQLLMLRERLLARRDRSGPTGVIAVLDASQHVTGTHNVPLALALVIARGGAEVSYVEVGRGSSAVLEEAQETPTENGDQEGVSTYSSPLHPSLQVSVADEMLADGEPISRAVRHKIQSVRTTAVVVLALATDSPPAAIYAALRLADSAILLVSEGVTRRSEIEQVVDDAGLLGSQVVGSVIVPKRRRAVESAGSHRERQSN